MKQVVDKLCDWFDAIQSNIDRNKRRQDPDMFVVVLKFSDNKAQAKRYMDGHNDWIKRGFDEGVFLLSGSIQPSSGGVVLAHNISLSELESRINNDPFVAENVVYAEILEITPGKTDERLSFLINVPDQ